MQQLRLFFAMATQLLHLVGIISLLSMMHGTTNIKFIYIYIYIYICHSAAKGEEKIRGGDWNTEMLSVVAKEICEGSFYIKAS